MSTGERPEARSDQDVSAPPAPVAQPGAPVHRAAPGQPSRALLVVAAVVVVALVGGLAVLLTRGGGGADGRRTQAGDVDAEARDKAVRAILDRRAAAVLDRDEQAWLADVDPRATDFRRA